MSVASIKEQNDKLPLAGSITPRNSDWIKEKRISRKGIAAIGPNRIEYSPTSFLQRGKGLISGKISGEKITCLERR
jgi:hypothetical protein